MERGGQLMKCTLLIYHNETNNIKDRKLVNTIEEEGVSAYKRLSTLLIMALNDSPRNSIWTTINRNGLHEFKGYSHTREGYEYHYIFEGEKYKYTLPQAMDEISRLKKESKKWCDEAENLRKLAQEEIRIQRRFQKKLKELGVTNEEIEKISGQKYIINE